MAAKRRSTTSRTGTSRRARSGSGGDGGELRSDGQVKTALIRGNTFAAKAVQYVELDGLAIFEGDIVLGTAEEVAAHSDQLRAETEAGVASAVLISGSQFRWPNCRVPFTIDSALPNQARVTNAIAHWEANTAFRFVARTTEADYVTFRPGSGCSSSVGRRGGQQFVNLASGCTLGNVIHEIGHVVGLWHEQSREDRDLFVSIQWHKIISGTEHNFNQHITDGDDVGAYDFGSIMHYPRNAFSVDGSDTIVPVVAVPAGVTIGQRNGLSAGDIAAANSMCATGPKMVKEVIKDVRIETIKEQIKDIRLDTQKEIITDTLKEQIRDTIKEGVLDPGPTIAENVITPGRPVVQPAVTAPGGLPQRPFVVATPASGGTAGVQADSLEAQIAHLDDQLRQLADQLAQAEVTRQALQAQYDESQTLMTQLLQQHEAGSR